MGINDLCLEMGVPGKLDDVRVVAAVQTVVAACKRHGKWAGLGGVYGKELLKRYIDMGTTGPGRGRFPAVVLTSVPTAVGAPVRTYRIALTPRSEQNNLEISRENTLTFFAFRSFLFALPLTLLPVAAVALEYIEAEEVLNRLDRRVATLETLAAEIYRDGEAIARVITVDSKPLEANLTEKIKTFHSARETSTVKAALAEGDSRGLLWYCEHASKAVPRLTTLASDVARLGQNYQTAIKATPLSQEGAAAALETAIDDLQTGLERTLDQAQHEQMRSQLKELVQGLPYTYGAYTTLRLVAGEAEMQTRQLDALAARLHEAAEKIEKPVPDFVKERDEVRKELRYLSEAKFADAALENRYSNIRTRVDNLQTSPLKEAHTYAVGARDRGDRFRLVAKQASAEVYAAMKPMHEAARQCGEHDDPPRQFSDARLAASRSVIQAVNTIESTGATRLAAVETERKNLAKALATYREVFRQAFDKRSTVWRQLEVMAPDAPGRKAVRDQHDRLFSREKEARRALEEIPLAQAACQAELEVLKRRLPGVEAFTKNLRALFPKEEG